MKDEAGPEDLGARTKRFSLSVIRLYGCLPRGVEAQVIGRQLLRSGTSVGAQYREAKRARSDAEFISKMCSSQQELEETIYWLELLVESRLAKPEALSPLLSESDEPHGDQRGNHPQRQIPLMRSLRPSSFIPHPSSFPPCP